MLSCAPSAQQTQRARQARQATAVSGKALPASPALACTLSTAASRSPCLLHGIRREAVGRRVKHARQACQHLGVPAAKAVGHIHGHPGDLQGGGGEEVVCQHLRSHRPAGSWAARSWSAAVGSTPAGAFSAPRTFLAGCGASPFLGLAGVSALAMPLRRCAIVSSRYLQAGRAQRGGEARSVSCGARLAGSCAETGLSGFERVCPGACGQCLRRHAGSTERQHRALCASSTGRKSGATHLAACCST